MTWSTWQQQLPVLFGVLLGSAAAPMACAWADQPRQMHVGARAQLTILATPSQGVEDRRRHVVEGALVEEAIGQRAMVLQLDVWSPRQPLDQSARRYLETLRTRLAFDSTQAALKALRLSLQRVGDPVDLDAIEDGRKVSRWAIDITLGYAWSERDEDNVGTWIETARITTDTVRDVDDTDLPDALQHDIHPPES